MAHDARPRDGLTRTFIAVEVPAEAKRALDDAVEPVRKRYRLRWSRPESWHFTLRFLGEITGEEVERAIGAAQRTAGALRAFDVQLGGWGAFPGSDRPRVLWVGAAAGAGALTAAAETLERSIEEAGFPRETKRFRPHLTIARVDPASAPAGRDAFLELSIHEFDAGAFPVGRIVVFKSVLDRAGARHHPLAECALG